MRSSTLIILMMAVMAVFSADALTITPTWTPSWNGAPDEKLNPLSATQVEIVLGLAAGTLTEVYKDEITDEEGTLAGSYETVYTPSSANASGATIIQECPYRSAIYRVHVFQASTMFAALDCDSTRTVQMLSAMRKYRV